MKPLSWIFGCVALIIISFFAYNRFTIHAASVAWSSQKWGEIADPPKVVSLKPGQPFNFGPFAPTTGEVLHYEVSSSLPVRTGVVQPIETPSGTRLNATCVEAQVLTSSKNCGVDTSRQIFLFVSDSRTQGEIVAGVLLGNKQVAMDNRVSITTYHWGCVADCVK